MAKQNQRPVGAANPTEQNTPAVTTPLVPAEEVAPQPAETETPPAPANDPAPESGDQQPDQAEQNTPGGEPAGDATGGGDQECETPTPEAEPETAEDFPTYKEDEEVVIVATDKSSSMKTGKPYTVSGHSANYLISKGFARPA